MSATEGESCCSFSRPTKFNRVKKELLAIEASPPIHTMEGAEPGDSQQRLPFFDRLLFEYLREKDNGLPLDEIGDDSNGKFIQLFWIFS